MNTVLQPDNQPITEHILFTPDPMFPQLEREDIIDQAIARITCTVEEVTAACQKFYTQNQIRSESDRQTWLKQRGINQVQFEAMATRELKIEKFKRLKWQQQLPVYFLRRKRQLDKVVFSSIRTRDLATAQALYTRILAGQQSFVDMVKQDAENVKTQIGDIQHPCEISMLLPALAQLLRVSKPGQLWAPIQLGEWFVIVRLEQFVPAQLDKPTAQRLLDELFEKWIQNKLREFN